MPEPKFVPRPDQTDFTNIRWCPVINCVVKYGDKFLIVQRSSGMRLYPRHWNGISGFLDDDKDLEQKVREELREELGIQERNITSITSGEIFHQHAPELKKTWIVHPVLVEVDSDQITLDWEAQKYEWIALEDVKNFKLLPGFDTVVEKVAKILL